MKALVRKTPAEIAKELNEETVEVGADFSEKVTEKLKKHGYDQDDMKARREVVSTFRYLRG